MRLVTGVPVLRVPIQGGCGKAAWVVSIFSATTILLTQVLTGFHHVVEPC